MNLEDRLDRNGRLIREHRLKGESIHSHGGLDANMIFNARQAAFEKGYTMDDINRVEMFGENGGWIVHSKPYEATFRGLQTICGRFTVRLYNVEGDHKLNGSTIFLMTAVNEGIPIYDISFPQVIFEYLKETLLIGWINFRMKVGL